MTEKVFLTGAKGRLGGILAPMLMADALDISIVDRDAIDRALSGASEEDVLVNCAAYTDVDGCEMPENTRWMYDANLRGVGYLRSAFPGYMIHFSTSFVFDGTDGPYSEWNVPSPCNAYGWSKLGGEAALAVGADRPSLIVRVESLYGGYGRKGDFVSSIRDRLTSGGGNRIGLPAKVYRTPTYVPHLAEAIVDAIPKRLTGILHLAGRDLVSMFEWGVSVAAVFGLGDTLIVPDETGRPSEIAPRPAIAGLTTDRARLHGIPVYGMMDGLVALRQREETDAGDTDILNHPAHL